MRRPSTTKRGRKKSISPLIWSGLGALHGHLLLEGRSQTGGALGLVGQGGRGLSGLTGESHFLDRENTLGKTKE